MIDFVNNKYCQFQSYKASWLFHFSYIKGRATRLLITLLLKIAIAMGIWNSYHFILSDTLSRPASDIYQHWTVCRIHVLPWKLFLKNTLPRIFIVAATSEVIVLKRQLDCHTLKAYSSWNCFFFILKVPNIRCFILIKCSEQEASFKKYVIIS